MRTKNQRSYGRMHTGLMFFLITVVTVSALSGILYLNTRRDGPIGSQLHVFCAAGMRPPYDATVARYQEEFGVEFQSQYAGSGKLLTQIGASKRGDIYIAADSTYAEQAKERGLVDETIRIARIRPVIAVGRGNPKSIKSIDDFLKPDVRFAIADERGASVGRVTKALLEDTGQWNAVQSAATVVKPTVTEVANDIKVGAVDAGVIWDAVAHQFDGVDIVPHPIFDRAEPQYVTLCILKTCEDPAGALRFGRYLAAPGKGQVEFSSRDYEPVNGDEWVERPQLELFSGSVNRPAIQDTVEEFRIREGVDINVIYNGCGNLVVQMKTGKIPDAYFACDSSFVTEVAVKFGESLTISEMSMVIITQKGNPKGIRSLAALGRPGLKVTLGHPQKSALGALTENLLKRKGLLAAVHANLVSESSTADVPVSQVQIGAADAAVVYEANTVESKDEIEIIPIDDPDAHAVQPFVISKGSRFPDLTARLRSALVSAISRKRFEMTGFRWLLEEKQP